MTQKLDKPIKASNELLLISSKDNLHDHLKFMQHACTSRSLSIHVFVTLGYRH
jgi:hypothetical protein